MTKHQEAPAHDEAVPDLYQLAFMPGQFRCPSCGFQLSKQTISLHHGAIGTTEVNRQSEPCPNDGTMMVHVTYREQLEMYAQRLKEEFDQRDTLLARNRELETALLIAAEAQAFGKADGPRVAGLMQELAKRRLADAALKGNK